jgi:hypothetical protein
MNLSDYVDVPTRFAALLAKWPELRIKEHRPEIVTIGDKIIHQCHDAGLANT